MNEIKVFYPTCRFCGKKSIPTEEYVDQDTADEEATLSCDCPEAIIYKNQIDSDSRREVKFNKLSAALSDFADYCKSHNTEVNTTLLDYLLSCGVAVLDEKILSAVVKFDRMKINFGKNSKDNIVISITYGDGTKVEV